MAVDGVRSRFEAALMSRVCIFCQQSARQSVGSTPPTLAGGSSCPDPLVKTLILPLGKGLATLLLVKVHGFSFSQSDRGPFPLSLSSSCQPCHLALGWATRSAAVSFAVPGSSHPRMSSSCLLASPSFQTTPCLRG